MIPLKGKNEWMILIWSIHRKLIADYVSVKTTQSLFESFFIQQIVQNNLYLSKRL